MLTYTSQKKTIQMPRLPLEGNIDITYRCNNNCRHCWLKIPSGVHASQQELTFDEIKGIIDQARSLGSQRWSISGGEPMLRPDFAEILGYITRKSISYSLNTNGTLITPEIARLMKRKGRKMIGIYGATAKVHDHITRNPGSFDAVMQGIAYLKENGVSFIVQLVPMRDNYHQWDKMQILAKSLSPNWRIGAAWLYLSATGDQKRNQEIMHQRLDPSQVIALDKPNLHYQERLDAVAENQMMSPGPSTYGTDPKCLHLQDDRLFASCLAHRCDFHIDPYGFMTFCAFIKDPALRYDLRHGDFEQCWEDFIPSLSDIIRGGKEYFENCGTCELRDDCRWCPVYGYLEHGRFSAPVEYLCNIARAKKEFEKDWLKNHRRYYQCAGITIQVDSDLPIRDATFNHKFNLFQVEGPGDDMVYVSHHFGLPDLTGKDLGKEVYRRPPWAIYQKGCSWIYTGISTIPSVQDFHRVAISSNDHTKVRIYNDKVREDSFLRGDLHSLTLFSTDQILLSHVLADREGCFLHSSGIIMDGSGLLFVGHSDAGKSTIVTMFKEHAEILCDDRNIVRRFPEGYQVSGTWHHGDVPDVSPSSAPLRAIMFLEQAPYNSLIPLSDRREIIKRLLACLIKPFETVDWWGKSLTLLENMACEVPCYVLNFSRSGGVVDVIKNELLN